ncbi:MAG: UDP-3-O-(3-hydroxymyristoyl)glucosamine N-acyltransferase [Acidobacteria bacterium]|nr:UDP-3-O-(3-hydroxymyristoyl)glucosamine N-acyltransferase [Acidobacteriota bacterium]
MKLREIAERLGAELHGNGDVDVTGVAGIEEAGPDKITFVANPKYAGLAKTTKAAAVLVHPGFSVLENTATLRIANPYLAFARTIEMFYQPPVYKAGIHPTSVISDSAQIGERAHIGAYVVIGDGVVIGRDAVILPHVVIYDGVKIGDRFFAHAHVVVREFCELGNDVVLQNGAVIGADGFGFAKGDGRWNKIVQAGRTILQNEIEVQANACVDRASVGDTVVKTGAKIDNLVQVGHGSTVGERTLLCAQVGLAGSTVIGNDVILAGQVGVAGHLTVGDGSIATAQTGIPNDVAPGAVVSGYPAVENKQWLRQVAIVNKLPEIVREMRKNNRPS